MKLVVASLVVWGALATCAVMRDTTVTDSQAAAFQIGAATPADVVARLGAPFGRGNDADGSVVLDYVHWSMIPLDASQRQVIFRFGPDRRLAKIETVHLDGAIFTPLTSTPIAKLAGAEGKQERYTVSCAGGNELRANCESER
jgi:hypothetical protein